MSVESPRSTPISTDFLKGLKEKDLRASRNQKGLVSPTELFYVSVCVSVCHVPA